MENGVSNFNIDDLVDQKYMHKKYDNGVFLSEYQIDILNSYGINPLECSSINELIFLIDELIDDGIDELDPISREIMEFNYYSNTNK